MLKGHTPAQDKIIQKDFENLCGMWCTEVEIADFFDVDEDTLNTWCKKTYDMTFSEIYKKKSTKGNISLRRAQLKLAIEKLHPTMAIWLGKQYLNQKEPEQEVKHSGEINNTFINAINEASNKVWNEKKEE